MTWSNFLRMLTKKQDKKKVHMILFLSKKIKRKPYIMLNVHDYMNIIKTVEKQAVSLEHALSEEIWGDICVREGKTIPRKKEERKGDYV